MNDHTCDPAGLVDRVRARYAAAAASVRSGTEPTCGEPANGPGCCAAGVEAGEGFGVAEYAGLAHEQLPDAATRASLGSGDPVAVAGLQPGETVLDLGAGGGLDVLLAARRVGEDGMVYGLDMTEEMVELARRNAVAAGAGNVEFLTGRIEAIPLPDEAVDVIISNCTVNLSVDKPAVFAEMYRVLRPGGRIVVSDVIAEDRLSTRERAERGSYVGCIAGALSEREYREGLGTGGFGDVDVAYSHAVRDGLHSAVVRAAKRV